MLIIIINVILFYYYYYYHTAAEADVCDYFSSVKVFFYWMSSVSEMQFVLKLIDHKNININLYKSIECIA